MSLTPMSSSSPQPLPKPITNSPIPHEQLQQRQDLLEHLGQVKQLVANATPWVDTRQSALDSYIGTVEYPERVKPTRIFVAFWKNLAWTYIVGGFLVLFAQAYYLHSHPHERSSGIPWMTIHIVGIGSAIVVSVLWMLWLHMLTYPRLERKTDAENEKREEHNIQVWQEYEEPALVELSKIHHEYMERFSHWFPEDYLTPNAVNALYAYVRQGRAYTMQDALNLYEQEKHQLWVRLSMDQQAREARVHRAIVQDLMAEQIQEQRRTNRLVQSAVVAASAAAAAASSAAAAARRR